MVKLRIVQYCTLECAVEYMSFAILAGFFGSLASVLSKTVFSDGFDPVTYKKYRIMLKFHLEIG